MTIIIPSAEPARLAMTRRRMACIGLLLAAAIALPFGLSDYRVFQWTMVLVWAIALLGLNVLTGWSGQISLGHGAFYAIGAYATAIMIERFGVPWALTVPLAGVLCLAVGLLFGLPAARLDGLYLSLATFALGVAAPQLLKYKGLAPWTGGSQGLVLVKPDPPAWLPVSADQWLYLVCLAWAITLATIAWNLLRGRLGRAMLALRDAPIAARTVGIDTTRMKAACFGVSAGITGIAGALGAIVVQFVAPDSFTLFLSISLLTGVVIGGVGAFAGPLFGAIFIQFVPNLADQVSKSAPWAIYGAALIVCMLVMPHGIAGFLAALFRRGLTGVHRGRS